jgi:hypothetical protein
VLTSKSCKIILSSLHASLYRRPFPGNCAEGCQIRNEELGSLGKKTILSHIYHGSARNAPPS